MSGNHPDWNKGSKTQLLANECERGIIALYVDEKIAECGPDESHQLILVRPLTSREFEALDAIWADYDVDGNHSDGEWEEMWLNCGPISPAARAYLLSLKA